MMTNVCNNKALGLTICLDGYIWVTVVVLRVFLLRNTTCELAR